MGCGNIAVPAMNRDFHALTQTIKPTKLVIDKGLERSDVDGANRIVRPCGECRNDGEKGRFGLATRGGRADEQMTASAEQYLDGFGLNGLEGQSASSTGSRELDDAIRGSRPSVPIASLAGRQSALDQCEAKCDDDYEKDQKLCETWWKTTGRNAAVYRSCMERASEKYVKCYQDCKKDCGE